MGNAFLYGQGGSGGNKTYKGWKTGSISGLIIDYATMKEVTYLASIEADGEIATLRFQNDNFNSFFFDFTNSYYFGGLYADGTDAADVTRTAFSKDELTHIVGPGSSLNYKLYLKINSDDKKKVDIYGQYTGSKSSGSTSVRLGYEVAYY